MERAIVTGAAGFSGAILTECLVRSGVDVIAVVRPGSVHNERLKGVIQVECELENI